MPQKSNTVDKGLPEDRLLDWVSYWQGYRYSGMLENADEEEKQEAGEQIKEIIKQHFRGK